MEPKKIIRYLIYSACALIPLGLSLRFEPFVSHLSTIGSTKEFMSLGFSLAIVLLGFYAGGIRPIKNKLILAMVALVFISMFQAPSYEFNFMGEDIGGFWFWKPMFYAFLYLMLYAVIRSQDICVKKIMDIIIWASAIIGLFMIGQRFGFSQFLTMTPYETTQNVTAWEISGASGHPMFAGAFIAIGLPLALYRGNKIPFILMSTSVIFSQSMMGIGASVLALGFLGLRLVSKEFFMRWVVILGILSGIGIFTAYTLKPDKVKSFIANESSGRIAIWSGIFDCLKQKHALPNDEKQKFSYSWTGYGPGSFRYIFRQMVPSNFLNAHNEYLHAGFDYGLLGLGILFIFPFAFIAKYWHHTLIDIRVLALLSAFLAICITALGVPVWQNEPYRFLTIVLLACIEISSQETFT